MAEKYKYLTREVLLQQSHQILDQLVLISTMDLPYGPCDQLTLPIYRDDVLKRYSLFMADVRRTFDHLMQNQKEEPDATAEGKKEPKSVMLGLPATRPDDASVSQTLNVVEDTNHDHKIHVEFEAMMDYAESWGAYLADVGRAMARDYADYFLTNRADGDLFAGIADGFAAGVARKKVGGRVMQTGPSSGHPGGGTSPSL